MPTDADAPVGPRGAPGAGGAAPGTAPGWLPLVALGLLVGWAAVFPPYPSPPAGSTFLLGVLVAALLLRRMGLVYWPAPSDPGGTGRRSSLLAAGCLALLAGTVMLASFNSSADGDALQMYMVAGRVPFSDAAGYVAGARHLLHHGELTAWTCRRPVAAVLLAGALWLTGDNLMQALLIHVLVAWAALVFAAWAVARRLGFVAAVAFTWVCASFHSVFAGAPLSEHAGLALGLLGLGLLLGADGATHRFLAGLFALGVALSARAGAYLVLPALVVWSGWEGRRGFPGRAVAWSSLAVVLSQAVSPGLLAVVGTGGATYQGNASYSLYGIATGGRGWGAVFDDHPSLLAEADDSERSRLAYQWAWEEFVREPTRAPRWLAREWTRFVLHPGALFDFMPPVEGGAAVLLALTGLVLLVRGKHRGLPAWLLPALGGHLVSLPLLLDSWPRVTAATVGVPALVAAVGACWLAGERAAAPLPGGPGAVAAALAIPVLPAVLAVALALRGGAAPAAHTCPDGERPLLMRYEGGNVATRDEVAAVGHYWKGMPAVEAYTRLPLSATMMSGLDLLGGTDGTYVWVLGQPGADGMLRLCARDAGGSLVARAVGAAP